MFYHVIVETVDDKFIYQSDLKKEDIHLIMLDYSSVQEFQIDGYYLLKNNLKKFQIFESKNNISEIISYKEQEINYNGISEDDVFSWINEYKTYMQDITRKLTASYNNYKQETRKVKQNSNKVFLVHGHDEALKNEVENFIKDLNLSPIILHKQASEGATIIEKIESHANDATFGIVLYSPCDIGGKDVHSLQGRARQNVVFEHGFLIGSLGRSKTCAIVKGSLEKPNDISGLVYISHDNNEGWKVQLFRELKKTFKGITFQI